MDTDFEFFKGGLGSRGLTPIPEGRVVFDPMLERLKLGGPQMTKELKRILKIKKERHKDAPVQEDY